MDDETELLLTRAERSRCNPFLLANLSCEYRLTQASVFIQVLVFARAFSLAPFSESPDSKVPVLGMHFHHFGVNRRLKWKEKYSF